MSKDTEKNLFIVFSMPRLYQHLLSGLANYEVVANHFVSRIKVAHAFRQTDEVRTLSTLLCNIPIREYQLIAQYYLVWCKCRDQEYDTESLERIIEQTAAYKAKSLGSRAAFEGYKGDTESEYYFYTEALRASPTISEYIDISKALAVVKAKEGFHESAVKDLEELIPMIRHAEPLVYFDFLNSYAVELGETGRKKEACNISRSVASSPFIHAYPEWQETARELKSPNRSLAAVERSSRSTHNVLYMPEIQHSTKPQIRYNQPARVFNLQSWKQKMSKASNDTAKKSSQEMTDIELVMGIMQLSSQPHLGEDQLRRMLAAIEKIASESRKE
jgi:hypothetical protein